MNILAFIPARGGSKGIYKKNIRIMNGNPLIHYTIDAALKSECVNRIIVSSDDMEIIDISNQYNVDIDLRPAELANDNTSMNEVINYLLQKLKQEENYIPDIFLILQPTSPLRKSFHIDEAIRLLLDHKHAESIVSVVETPHNHSPYSVMELNGEKLEFYKSDGIKYKSRQEKPKFYSRNGAAIYAFRTLNYLETNSIYNDYCIPYFMRAEDSIDIDNEFDWLIAEFLMDKKVK